LLPLWLIFRARMPSLAAANGQCMLFRADSYRKYTWHQRVSRVVVEDIAIMQQVKAAGLFGMTWCSQGLVRTRMYRSFHEGSHGFGKNILAGFGGSIIGLVFFLMVVLGVPCALVFTGRWAESVVYLLGACFLRVLISRVAGQSWAVNVALHLPQMAALLWVSGLSVWKKMRKQNQWKGRNVNPG